MKYFTKLRGAMMIMLLSIFSFGQAQTCEYSVVLKDSFGDGWNGGSLDVYVNGNLVLDGITLAGGVSETFALPIDMTVAGSEVTTDYTSGGWATENSYMILDPDGNILITNGQGAGVVPTDIGAGVLTGLCVPADEPTMVVDPGMYAFDDVALLAGAVYGEAPKVTFTVTNGGLGNVEVANAYFFSGHAAEFNIVGFDAASLAFGDAEEFEVEFNPATPGNKFTLLVIEDASGFMTTYDVTGFAYEKVEGDVLENTFVLGDHFVMNEDYAQDLAFGTFDNDYTFAAGGDAVFTFTVGVDSFITVDGAGVQNVSVFEAGVELAAGNELLTGAVLNMEDIGDGDYVMVVTGSGDGNLNIHVEGADPIWTIDPDGTLDLGEVPVDAWHRGGSFKVTNTGGQFLTISQFMESDVDDVWEMRSSISQEDLPYELYAGDELTFDFNLNASAVGLYEGNFLIEDDVTLRVYPVRGTAYEAPVGDIVENPYNVVFDAAGAYTHAASVAFPMRNNYDAATATTRDAVYKFEVAADMLLDIEVLGTNPEFALLAADEITSTGPAFVTPIVDETGNTTDVELNAGEYYLIVALDAANPVYTLNLQADVMPVPADFALLTPVDGETNVDLEPTLTWEEAQYAQSYNLYYGTSYPPSVLVANLETTSYTMEEELLPANVYFWYVEAVNTTGVTTSATFGFTTEIPAPNQVHANLYDYDNVEVSWQNPFEMKFKLEEDFEGETYPPAGWDATTNSLSTTGGWTRTDNGDSQYWKPGEHTWYANANDDAANDDGSVDYLWMPEVDLSAYNEGTLSFASYYTGDYGTTAHILVTNDGGTTFATVADVTGGGAWVDVEIDLADFVNGSEYNTARLVFHCNDNGGWGSGWAVDDVKLNLVSNLGGGGVVLGYNVYQNGVQVNTELIEETTTYNVENLAAGSYEFCVSAVFPQGESPVACAEENPVEVLGRTEIFGHVTNADGGVVEGAKISFVGPNNTWETAVTDSTGYYTSTTADGMMLPVSAAPGYDVTCMMSGWETTTVTGLLPQNGVPLEQNFVLGDNAVAPGTVVATNIDNGENALVEWSEGSAGELYEISYTSDPAANAYYQSFGSGYGVVYDLTAYPDATLSLVDFYHASYGVTGVWQYNLRVVNWDTYEEVAVLGPFATTGDDVWETEVPLGDIPGLGGAQVAVLMEPLGNTADDAYPCIASDNNDMDGYSVAGSLSDYSAMQMSGIGDFLMDLWILTEMGGEPVMASKIPAVNSISNATARVAAPSYEVPAMVTPQAKVTGVNNNAKAFVGHSVYLLEVGQEQNPAAWSLAAEGIQESPYTDNNLWPNAEQGEYRYAVVANYTINNSEATLSNVIGKDMHFDAMITVATNSGESATGATVIMYNMDTEMDYSAEVSEQGYVQFDGLYKGNYQMAVMFDGYQTYEYAEYIYDDDYWIHEVTLQEALCAPAAISASTDCESVTLEWESPEDCTVPPVFGSADFKVELMTDTYGNETSWELTNANGVVATSEAYIGNALYTYETVLNGGDYTFTIYDSYGDGMCCNYGEGYYKLYLDGELLTSGGEFGASEATEFSVGVSYAKALKSITTSYYAEDHGYAKGEEVVNASSLETVSTTETFNNDVVRGLEGYNVYMNGALVGEGVDATTYTIENLMGGEYTFAVSAVYVTGESDQVSVDVELADIIAPYNLEATAASWNNVVLTWELPDVAITTAYLYHHNNTLDDPLNSIGIGDAFDFDVASRFTAAQIAGYNGLYVTEVAFVPAEEACEYSIRIWTGADAANMVVDQVVTNPTIGDWNVVALDTPVMIDASQELWIGYRSNTTTGYPAGVDAGPAVAGFGDMIYDAEAGWVSMSETYGLDYNWLITATVTSVVDAPVATLSPIADDANRIASNGKLGVSASDFTPASFNKNTDDLVGFTITREHNVTGETVVLEEGYDQLFYTDFDLPVAIGQDNIFTYQVTAVYTGSCDASSNTVDVMFEADVDANAEDMVNVYPNPATDVVNVELSANVETVKVLNAIGQVVYAATVNEGTHVINTTDFAAGAYVIQTVSNGGDVQNHKVVITK